jgi:hypothetical protein
MATGCNYQEKCGRDRFNKQLYRICGLACEPGQVMCPRHTMLAPIERAAQQAKLDKKLDAKLAAAKAKNKAVTSARR